MQAVSRIPLSKFINARLPSAISSLIVKFTLVQWGAAWTHIVISKPRHKFCFRRLPLTHFTLLNLLLILLVSGVLLEEFVSWLEPKLDPRNLKGRFNAQPSSSASGIELFHVLWKLLLSMLQVVVPFSLRLLSTVPLDIVQTRVEASFLPWIDEPNVPIDRSFGNGSDSNSVQNHKPNHANHRLAQHRPANLFAASEALRQVLDDPTL